MIKRGRLCLGFVAVILIGAIILTYMSRPKFLYFEDEQETRERGTGNLTTVHCTEQSAGLTQTVRYSGNDAEENVQNSRETTSERADQRVVLKVSNEENSHQSGTDDPYKIRNAAPSRREIQSPLKVQQVNEIRQIVFAKVHKAASSTLQNLLLRFAMARELNVLLPKGQDHINEISPVINRNHIITHPQNKPFDILCNHLVFNAEQIARFIPSTAFRFGILREPLSQVLSAIQYYITYYLFPGSELYRAARKYKKDPIQGFLNYPHHFCNEVGSVETSSVDNRMSLDLGFSPLNMYRSKRNKTKVQEFVSQVDRQFDLMLICEYFDESLVLLRIRLHWQLKDILYLKANVAVTNDTIFKSRTNITLTPQQQKTFQVWSAVDIALYDHFLQKFLKQIQKEKFFREELAAFREVRSRISDYCRSTNSANIPSIKIPASSWTQQFSVTVSDCQNMLLSEGDIVEKVRSLQLARFAQLKG